MQSELLQRILFADKPTLFYSGENIDKLIKQRTPKKIKYWFDENRWVGNSKGK